MGSEAQSFAVARSGMARVDATLTAEDGTAELTAMCLKRDAGPLAILVLQPPGGSTTLVERIAETVR